MIISESKRLLLERHKDLVNFLARCRIMIEEREDPTMLDIMTDMRALEGIVTVRQTRPISDPVTANGHRIVELNISYIPKYIEAKDKFMHALESLKKVEGVDMIKVMEHLIPLALSHRVGLVFQELIITRMICCAFLSMRWGLIQKRNAQCLTPQLKSIMMILW